MLVLKTGSEIGNVLRDAHSLQQLHKIMIQLLFPHFVQLIAVNPARQALEVVDILINLVHC